MKQVVLKNKNNEKVLPDFITDDLSSNSHVKIPSVYAVSNIAKNCVHLGEAVNETVTITLTDGTLNDYRFLCVSSGWGYNKSTTIIPVFVFKLFGVGFLQCNQYVKTYDGNAYTNIQYVDDTSFIINGAAGPDTITNVYGIK